MNTAANAQTPLTDAEVMAEAVEVAEDLESLVLDLRKRRNAAAPGAHKSRLRAVGSALEDALREAKKAADIATNGLPFERAQKTA